MDRATRTYLQKELGLPKSLDADSAAEGHSRSRSWMERLLGLEAIRYRPYLSPCSWLAGGAVRAWLLGEEEESDFDFFFPDVAALDLTFKRMLDDGFKVTGFQGRTRTEESEGMPEGFVPFWPVRDWIAEELIEEEIVRAINLESTEGHDIQLVMVIRQPSPLEVIQTFDFSICQFALDDSRLWFSAHSWTDLLRRRLRVERIHHPLSTLRRCFKYMQKGYWACNGTLIAIAQAVAAHPLDERVISLD